MQIQAIDHCAVTVSLSPGDALLLADACRLAGLHCTEEGRIAEKQVYNLAAAHFDALALLGSAQGLVAENIKFLEEWTLPRVREDWAIVGNAGKEVAK
jgi:hypothetical protein